MPSKETMDVIEKTLGAVEETAETIERIPKVNLNGTTKKQQIIILGVTAVVSAVVASELTFLWTKKKLKTHYEELANAEIAEARAHYTSQLAVVNKQAEYSDPELLAEHLGLNNELVEEERYSTPNRVVEDSDGSLRLEPVAEVVQEVVVQAQEEVVNIFSQTRTVEDFDLEEEEKTRTPHQPYVLMFDEFQTNENDWEQDTLMWFEADDLLCDEKGDPIINAEELVGEDNLHRFGHGSRDPNIVYVRNEQREMEFEIRRQRGKYAQVVHGFKDDSETELRHSARRPGKFRGSDE